MKTTLRKLISEINFEDTSIQDDVNWEDITSIFDIFNLYWSEDKRLKTYFIKTWYCTDSYVGVRAYFLDGEFVAISEQNGRKSNEDFEFTSKKTAKKVRDYLLSLVDEENEVKFSVITDLDKEIEGSYKIEHNSQIRHKTSLLGGERVTILKKNYPHNTEDYFHTVEIQKEDGELLKLDCRELDFEYNTLS